ncbi:MAG: leucine-rich repeat domain-containing protein [Bacteroidales bacterium]|nr:leucine-rich repeat domain-containing protein [Bacteroidales bacterium]
MKRNLIFSLFALLASSSTWADNRPYIKYDFIVDGIYYRINPGTGNTVAVTYDHFYMYEGKHYSGDINIPSSVTYNGINYSVTEITDEAFEMCDKVTSVTIPESVTAIGDDAFSFCDGLTSLTIPNSVTDIEKDAFYCVKNVVYSGTAKGEPWGALTINGFFDGDFIYADAEKTKLTAYIGKGGDATIPNGVTSVGPHSFEGSNLTSVVIPESVTEIGEYAFYASKKLKAVNIPSNITKLNNCVFSLCSSLTTITIPEKVVSIGTRAFEDCSSLTSLSIPESVTEIKELAFHACNGLTSIVIPSGVTTIGSAAFGSCKGLTTVTFSSNIKTIGTYAFEWCDNLTTVKIHATEPPALLKRDIDHYNYVFCSWNIDNTGFIPVKTFYIPKGTIEAYKGAWETVDYGKYNFVEMETAIDNITIDNRNPEGIYDIMGQKLNAPQKGINIINGKKVLIR